MKHVESTNIKYKPVAEPFVKFNRSRRGLCRKVRKHLSKIQSRHSAQRWSVDKRAKSRKRVATSVADTLLQRPQGNVTLHVSRDLISDLWRTSGGLPSHGKWGIKLEEISSFYNYDNNMIVLRQIVLNTQFDWIICWDVHTDFRYSYGLIEMPIMPFSTVTFSYACRNCIASKLR